MAYYSEKIEVYELENENILDKEFYNLFDKDVGKKLNGKAIIYPISLNKNSQTIIYIKNKSLTHQLIDIKILNSKQTLQYNINSNFYFHSFLE